MFSLGDDDLGRTSQALHGIIFSQVDYIEYWGLIITKVDDELKEQSSAESKSKNFILMDHFQLVSQNRLPTLTTLLFLF